MLQNGQKDMGKIEFEKTEATPKGKLALSSLVHEELANLIVIRIETGENVAEFTSRLQTQERFMRWVISTVLQQAEASQLLQMADTQFFKVLKAALPERMEYMGSNTQGGFTKLCSMVLESSASSSQNISTPKKVAFVSLGGALSRQPGAKITGETRTEKHNKTVVTSYEPKEIEGKGEGSSSGEEEEFEKRMGRLSKVVKAQMKAERSPAKGRSSALRDDQEAPEDAEKASQDQVISLLKEIQSAQAKTLERKPMPLGNECFQFASKGSCFKGNLCRFEHQGGAASSTHPQNPKRSRQEYPPPGRGGRGACFDFQRGRCSRGAGCSYSHEQGEQTMSRKLPIEYQGKKDCERARRTGICGDSRCPDHHGKTNPTAPSMCKHIREGGPCHHQWTLEGCHFSHVLKEHRREDHRRPEHANEKNGRGSGRADRFRK
jgi:hypothetical protein